MQTKELFSQQMDDFLQSVSLAMSRTDAQTFWPGSGGQLTGSYIETEALDVFKKLGKMKGHGKLPLAVPQADITTSQLYWSVYLPLKFVYFRFDGNVDRLADDYVVVKAPQFSFSRLAGADPMLGVEMASTGEVACLGDDLHEALLKSLAAAGFRRPRPGKAVLLSLGGDEAKVGFLTAARRLHDMGLRILATQGTATYLSTQGLPTVRIFKESDGRSPGVVETLRTGDVDLVVNIPHAHSAEESADGYRIRRTAVDLGIPLVTNPQLARLIIKALADTPPEALVPKPWSAYR